MDQESISYRNRNYFSRDKKQEILKQHTDQGIPISQLARENGIHAVTIYQWKRLMSDEKKESDLTPAMLRELIAENSKLKKEIKQLKYKVADLSVSNDILNDALEIAKKNAILEQIELLEKSKKLKNTK
jgi:transposase-like protein